MKRGLIDILPVAFNKAIAVEILDSHTYKVNLREAFALGSVPNGGYTAACMLAAAKIHLSSRHQPDAFTSHFEYPDRAITGPAIVSVEDVNLGRQRSLLHLTMWQGGLLSEAPWTTPNVSRRVVLAYTNHIDLENYTGISLPSAFEESPSAKLPPVPDFKTLQLEGRDEAWEEQSPPPYSTIVRSLHNWHFYLPRAGNLTPGVTDIWVRLANGERIIQAMLPYLVDSFPYNLHLYLAAPELRHILQPQSDKKPNNEKNSRKTQSDEPRESIWLPTVTMDLEVKATLPKEGVEWISMRVVNKKMQQGRFDLDVTVMTTEAEIVALSHHVAMIVSIEKNMAQRRSPTRAAL